VVCPSLADIRDELQKRPIRIPKVNRESLAAGAGPRNWSELYFDGLQFEVVDRLVNRAGPFKTEITSARWNRNLCQRMGLDSGAVQIQLRIFKPVSPISIFRDKRNSDNIAIKCV